MPDTEADRCTEARAAAVEVLLHNRKGPHRGLPRTAGWGYPEPYTRDLMIASLGALVSGSDILVNTQRLVLETAAKHQSPRGHIPSLIDDSDDRGASDTTPLFLLATAIFREVSGDHQFLKEAVEKALCWMDYQSPDDRVIVSQLPTSDWRDEQWVLGYGLFVNTIVYSYLRMYDRDMEAETLLGLMTRFTVRGGVQHRHVHEGLRLPGKPYYAMWSYKIYSSERFDLLGNSLAILAGMASPSRADNMITWVEHECDGLKRQGDLVVDLPPNFFPFVREGDPDWLPRYQKYNRPGEYHNGGVWPFVCGFYIAALVAAGRHKLAARKLEALTELVRPAREADVTFGFNEWFKAQDGRPMGQDWQTWSAAMYLYAAECVQSGRTPFFEDVRKAR